jgi:hypothetical protein
VGAIGPNAHGVVNKYIYQAPQDLGDRLVRIEAMLLALTKANVPADIAPAALAQPAMGAALGGGAVPKPGKVEEMARHPSASLSGLLFRPPASSAQIEALTGNYSEIVQLVAQLKAQGGEQGEKARVVRFNNRDLDLIELFLKQGNVALWDFRRKASRLFGDHRLAMLRAQSEWPHPPALQQFHAQAQSNMDVFRGLILFYLMRGQRPDLLLPALEQFMAGRWRQVLEDWQARNVFPEEMIEYTRTDLQAVGEPYRPEEARAALQETTRLFNEVLKRQPENTVALVNLALLEAESATFYYIESGKPESAQLQRAHERFGQARKLLEQRSGRESRLALAKCIFYEAASLPADAVLESARLAALQVQLYRASFTQRAQQTLNWAMMQRNMARNDPGFFRIAEIQRARDLFLEAGDHGMAEQCARQIQMLEFARAMLPQMMQFMQAIQPVVGSWACYGKTMQTSVQGMLVFDGEGLFHWRTDVQGMGGVQRFVCEGVYQVMGNMIYVRGERWQLQAQPAWTPAMPMMAVPFEDQLLIQGNMGGQLVVFSQQQGVQLSCRRL